MKAVSRCTNTLKDPNGPVFVVRFDSRGEYCLSGGQDRKVKLWNPFLNSSEAALIQTYSGHSWEVYDISISHDGTCFASCGGDRQAFYWDTATGRVIRQFQGHHLKLNSVAFNEDSSVLVSGSEDKTVRLWDCKSFSRFPIQILEDAKDSITSISIRGSVIAAASIDGHVRLYDIRKGCMNADNLHESVTSIRLGIDNQCYLASIMNSTVQLMDGPSGAVLNNFTGHKHTKYRLESCFSKDESIVYSCSEDGRVCGWDLLTAEQTVTLAGHSLPVTSVVHHPKKSILLSASTDGTIKLWE